MDELTGTLRCDRWRNLRRGNALVTVMRDIMSPLPDHELWYLHVADDTSPVKDDDGNPYRFYKARSGRLPKGIPREMENQEITIKAKVIPWDNGMGGYLERARLAD